LITFTRLCTSVPSFVDDFDIVRYLFDIQSIKQIQQEALQLTSIDLQSRTYR